MKKLFSFTVCCAFVGLGVASADGLKNSLNNFTPNTNRSSTVNLGQINLNGNARPAHNFAKKRSGNTIIATVDGYKVRKKEADAYLNKVTKGKVKDYDRLPKKQRSMVIDDLVSIHKRKNFKSRPPEAVIATVNDVELFKKDADSYLDIVTSGNAKDFDLLDKTQQRLLVEDLARQYMVNNATITDISEEEKDAIFKQIWVEKKMAKTLVTNSEMMAFYEDAKKKALAQNPQAEFPSYMSIGMKIKAQVVEQKIMAELMKDMKIEIYKDLNTSIDKSSTTQVKKEK